MRSGAWWGVLAALVLASAGCVNGPSQPPAPVSVPRVLSGTVEAVSMPVLWIRDSYGNLWNVQLDESTHGRVGERGIPLDTLVEGMPVRAVLTVREGREVAREVEVLPR